jgi:hypothetical protein
MFFFDPVYLLLMAPAFILVMLAQWQQGSELHQYEWG